MTLAAPPDPLEGKRFRIRCGEAFRHLRRLPTGSVDLVCTDPPYSSGGQFRGDRASGGNEKYVKGDYAFFAGDNRDQRSYLAWSSLWLTECLRASKPGAIVAVFTDWRQLPITTDAIQAGGWVWRGIVPWIKPFSRPQIGRPTQCAEFVVWGTNGARELEGEAFPGFYLMQPPRGADRIHPTEKPEEMMRSLVRLAPVGGIVLDPFAGSGTTIAAALAEDRRGLGYELTAHYARHARARCEAILGNRERHAPQEQGALFG